MIPDFFNSLLVVSEISDTQFDTETYAKSHQAQIAPRIPLFNSDLQVFFPLYIWLKFIFFD